MLKQEKHQLSLFLCPLTPLPVKQCTKRISVEKIFLAPSRITKDVPTKRRSRTGSLAPKNEFNLKGLGSPLKDLPKEQKKNLNSEVFYLCKKKNRSITKTKQTLTLCYENEGEKQTWLEGHHHLTGVSNKFQGSTSHL